MRLTSRRSCSSKPVLRCSGTGTADEFLLKLHNPTQCNVLRSPHSSYNSTITLFHQRRPVSDTRSVCQCTKTHMYRPNKCTRPYWKSGHSRPKVTILNHFHSYQLACHRFHQRRVLHSGYISLGRHDVLHCETLTCGIDPMLRGVSLKLLLQTFKVSAQNKTNFSPVRWVQRRCPRFQHRTDWSPSISAPNPRVVFRSNWPSFF